MRSPLRHFRTYVVRGILAIVPIALSVLAIRFIYTVIDRRVTTVLEEIIGLSLPGIGILAVLIALYLLGLVASNIVGKAFLRVLRKIADRIPLISTTYRIGQQLADTLSLPERHVFRRAALVEYLKPGIWTIGFVTGTIVDQKANDENLLKLFIPTPPNPTSGTMVVVRESQTRAPGWTIDEASRTVLSGGIIGPTEFR